MSDYLNYNYHAGPNSNGSFRIKPNFRTLFCFLSLFCIYRDPLCTEPMGNASQESYADELTEFQGKQPGLQL